MTDEEFFKKIGEKIKVQRKSLKISQKLLAQKTNLSRSAITRIELGEINFSMKILRKIANELEVSESQLLSLEMS